MSRFSNIIYISFFFFLFGFSVDAVSFEDAPRAAPSDYYVQSDDGWWPYLSPDGKYVVYGNGGSYVAEIGKRNEFKDLNAIVKPSCNIDFRSGRWFDNSTIIAGCIGKDGPEMYTIKYGTWEIDKIDMSELGDFSASIGGGGLVAGDRHWALSYPGSAVVYDGTVIGEGLGHPTITGNLLYVTCDEGSNQGPICVYKNSEFMESFEIKGAVITMDAIGGYVTWGGYGGGWYGREPDGDIIDLGAGLKDGAPKMFTVDGKIWVATFNGSDSCVMHPWGQKESIIVDGCPAASWDISYDGKDIVIAAASDKGKLHIIKVPKDSPRVDLCGETCSNIPNSQVPTSVSAQGQSSPNPFSPRPQPSIPSGYPGFGQLISMVLTWAFRIVGISVFLMVFIAGLQWFLGGSNPGAYDQAKKRVTNAATGAVLLFAAYIILYTINPDLVRGTFSLPGIDF